MELAEIDFRITFNKAFSRLRKFTDFVRGAVRIGAERMNLPTVMLCTVTARSMSTSNRLRCKDTTNLIFLQSFKCKMKQHQAHHSTNLKRLPM